MPKSMNNDYASSILEELIPEETRNSINEENQGDLLAKELRRKKLAQLLMKLLVDGNTGETKDSNQGMKWEY